MEARQAVEVPLAVTRQAAVENGAVILAIELITRQAGVVAQTCDGRGNHLPPCARSEEKRRVDCDRAPNGVPYDLFWCVRLERHDRGRLAGPESRCLDRCFDARRPAHAGEAR